MNELAGADDRALDSLLAAEAPGFDRAALDALIEGVLAAPEPSDPAAWMALVAERPSPALAEALGERKRALAAARAPAPQLSAAERLSRLRGELERQGVQGFVVPRGDEHQGEYVPANAERLAWLTGFTGSAGTAIVLSGRAAVFSDGRYTLQLQNQVPGDLFDRRHITEEPIGEWLAEHLKKGERLGFDPRLHAPLQARQLKTWAEAAGAELVALEENPLDAVWEGRPPAPLSPAVPHSLDYAGEASEEKRARLADDLKKKGLAAAVLTLPESIAWLLNLRGGDVPHTPFTLSYAILKADGSLDWFVDQRKVTPALKRALGNSVTISAPESLGDALRALGAGGRKVLADPSSAGVWVFDRLEEGGATLERAQDPCLLPKATKNPIEVEGARAAHRRDGPAVASLLAWLDREALARHAAGDPVTEMEVSERLFGLRRALPMFRDLSFASITGAGPNGAIMHYRVTEESSRALGPGELFLLDSGGQFPDGTTDITRTVAIGEPSEEMRTRYTLVLKGHLALSLLRFPKGTTGSQIDALARQPLWQAGLDFDHGTGHGVGSYLSVHEGPQRISKVPNSVALKPGMILSNEPGYYKPGAYGIRIENLVTVAEAPPLEGQDREML
ncbi:MAG: M24B family metallopeptidase, partial [Limibacillus sp.]